MELIVVLVILAVLAALLIPSLTGYIDKAKKNQVIAETRMLTQAAQTELSSLYATDEFAAQNAYSSFTVASKDGSPLPSINSHFSLLLNVANPIITQCTAACEDASLLHLNVWYAKLI